MELFYRRKGEGTPLVILHGLFGSADNWGTIGDRLSDSFDVLLVDQRDHGRSPHSDHITYPLMAEDVHELVTGLGLKDIILVGHSMGGKTAMAFAQQWPELLRHLVVVDISPREHDNAHDHILEALLSADLSRLKSRKEVEEQLSTLVPEPGVVQFLMKSLYWKEPDRLAWRMNVALLAKDLPHILAAVGSSTVRVPTLFIRGGKSDYITREDLPAIREQFPNSTVETIPYAGHWVHAQAPDEVMDLIRALP